MVKMSFITSTNQTPSAYDNIFVTQEQYLQLETTAAIAPATQTENALATWLTSDPAGPTSDHNALKNNIVLLDDDGNFSAVNSIDFTEVAANPGGVDTLWLRDDTVLMLGADPISSRNGNVSSNITSVANEIATYTDTTGETIGKSYTICYLDDTSKTLIISQQTTPLVFTGVNNTFYGHSAGNPTDPVLVSECTAIGALTLANNTASDSTAIGSRVMATKTGAGAGTAVGARCLLQATTVNGTVAIGDDAGANITSSSLTDVFIGQGAGKNFTSSNYNICIGLEAGGKTSTAVACTGNMFIGTHAAFASLTAACTRNIVLGNLCGTGMTSNTDCIYIADTFAGTETQVIRIGNAQTKCFIKGIRGITTGVADALPVLVDSAGQLGTVSSSIKYKENIEDYVDCDWFYDVKMKTFNYICQPGHESIGTIAEDMMNIRPKLVASNGDDEPIHSVYYDKLYMTNIVCTQQNKKKLDDLSSLVMALNRDVIDLRQTIRELKGTASGTASGTCSP